MAGGDYMFKFLMVCLLALVIAVGWYSQKGPEVIGPAPVPPAPTPASPACTIINASAFTTGGMTAEVVVHTTRCGVQREISISGYGALDTAHTIDFPADTIAAGDMPYQDLVQLYTTRSCHISLGMYGNDLEVFAWIFADGSISVISSIVNNDAGLNPDALGAVWTDIVDGFPATYADGTTGLLSCDLSWTSATAAIASSGASVSAAGSRIGVSSTPAAIAAAKAKIRARTLALPKPRNILARPSAASKAPAPRTPSRRP